MNIDWLRFWKERRFASVVVGLIVMSLGCGESHPPTYLVRGTVRFRSGEPVRTGRIETKSSIPSAQARGEIAEDGSFTLTTFTPGDGAVAGTHQLVISQMVLLEDAKIVGHEHAAHSEAPSLVHPRYARYSTSGLSITIRETGENRPELIVEAATTAAEAGGGGPSK